jgi:hypothetical protein
VSGTLETADIRAQAKRRADALRLARRDDLRLALLPGRKVRVEPALPELVAAVRDLRPELAEMLEGHRCLRCGDPLADMTRVPAEGFGFVHRACSGYPRKAARR